MSTTATSGQASDITTPARTNRRWLWIVALVVVIAIAGIVLWFVFSGGDEEPTLTFDGEIATYSGPETIQTGTEVTVTLVNTSDELVKFVWQRLDEEHAAMTLEEVRAAFQAGEDVTDDGRKIGPQSGVPAHEDLDAEYELSAEGTYSLAAEAGHTDEQGMYETVFYAAVIIQVTSD
jgi:hypothetical protein